MQIAGVNVDTSGKNAVLCSCEEDSNRFFYKRPKGSNLKTQVKWHDKVLQLETLGFLGKKVLPIITKDDTQKPVIHLYNTHKVGAKRFTANPSHYTQKGCTEGWHDWALAEISGDSLPSDVEVGSTAIHMISFVEIKGSVKQVESDTVQCKGPGMYVMCHVLSKGGMKERAHPQSRIVNAGTKYCSRWDNKGRLGQIKHPDLFLLPVSVIRGVCCAVPDFMEINLLTKTDKKGNLNKREKKEKEHALLNPHQRYLFVSGKKLWKNIFETFAANPV